MQWGVRLALLSLSVRLFPAPAPTDFARELREAEQAKDYAAAARIYSRMVKLSPKDPVANRNLGLALYLQGKYSGAVPPLKAAASLDPALWNTWLYLGICLYRTNDFTGARAALERANRIKASDHAVKYWLGATHFAQKSYPEAISYLRAATKLSPRDSESLFLLARTYSESSAALLSRVLKDAPESAIAHRLKAEDALEEGMPRAAVLELRKALAISPADPAISALLRDVEQASNTGDLAHPVKLVIEAPAPEAIEEKVRTNPNDPEGCYLLGRAYSAQAEQTLNVLADIDPESYRVRLMRGEAYEKGAVHDFAKALNEYKKALGLEPGLPGLNQAIGRVLWKMRRFEDAVPYLRAEIDNNPSHALANYYLGSSYLFLQNTQQAIDFLRAAVRARPDLLQARRDLGRALAAARNFDDAIACYAQVLEADPDDASVHALMATAYNALGRTEDARRSAQLARDLSAKRNQPLQ
jgi:tetratricopeptide (TPR) repeat protein